MVQALRGVAHIFLLLGNAGFDDRNWSSLETQSGQRKADVGHPRIGMEGRCTIVKFFDDNDGNCASPRWYDPHSLRRRRLPSSTSTQAWRLRNTSNVFAS